MLNLDASAEPSLAHKRRRDKVTKSEQLAFVAAHLTATESSLRIAYSFRCSRYRVPLSMGRKKVGQDPFIHKYTLNAWLRTILAIRTGKDQVYNTFHSLQQHWQRQAGLGQACIQCRAQFDIISEDPQHQPILCSSRVSLTSKIEHPSSISYERNNRQVNN